MKYIQTPDDGCINFDRYESYIRTIVERFPAHLQSLVSEPRFYDLSSLETFHDAKLRSLVIRELPSNDKEMIPSSVEIAIGFDGAYRKMDLVYSRVRRYSVRGRNDIGYFDSFHSDLITHEFRIENDGSYVHEMAFATNSTIEIEFEDMRYAQKEYKA